MAVRDIARRNVVTATAETPIADIAGELEAENVGSIVIVEENRPVGLLTDRRIALSLGETDDPSSLAAGDLMADDLVTVSEDVGVFDLIQTMESEGIRRLPVVNDRGSLSGIVTLDDVLVLLGDELDNVAHIIRKQAPDY